MGEVVNRFDAVDKLKDILEQYFTLKQSNEQLQQRVKELEEVNNQKDVVIFAFKLALQKLMRQCRQTSNSIGKTGHRLFGSDDFMMVWEDVEQLLNK